MDCQTGLLKYVKSEVRWKSTVIYVLLLFLLVLFCLLSVSFCLLLVSFGILLVLSNAVAFCFCFDNRALV